MPAAPVEGSYGWARSAGISLEAKYDSATAALQNFTLAYSALIDAMSRGTISEDTATAAVGKLTAAYANAVDPLASTIRTMQQQAQLAGAGTPEEAAWQSTLIGAQQKYNTANNLDLRSALPTAEVQRLRGQFNTTWGAQQGSRISSSTNSTDDLLSAASVSPAALAYARTQDAYDPTQASIAGSNLLTQRRVTGQSEITSAGFDANQSRQMVAGYGDANKSVMALTASLAADKEAFDGQIDKADAAGVARRS